MFNVTWPFNEVSENNGMKGSFFSTKQQAQLKGTAIQARALHIPLFLKASLLRLFFATDENATRC